MDSKQNETEIHKLMFTIQTLTLVTLFAILACLALPTVYFFSSRLKETSNNLNSKIVAVSESIYWIAPNINTIQDTAQKKKILYGKALISHTSSFYGPKGSLAQTSNGMNCQNCHLKAGTEVFGNNYGSVASLYPKFRARSGTIETVYKRVNDCFERSLNGIALDTLSKEMQAIVAYIRFVGSNVKKGKTAAGSGLKEIS